MASMKLVTRLGLLGCGTLIVLYGVQMMHRSITVYRNWWKGTLYSPAIVVTGIFIALLCFLPPANLWTAG